MASIDELRAQLPEPPESSYWISNEPQDRFGLIAFGDEPPDLGELPRVIGKEPDIAEEFDVE